MGIKKNINKFIIEDLTGKIPDIGAKEFHFQDIEVPVLDTDLAVPDEETFEISDGAREKADRIENNFDDQLWDKAKQLALQRGSNTVDESDIHNAYKMIVATPIKSTKLILARATTRIGVFIGGIMFLSGISTTFETTIPKLLLLFGGLIIALLSAILDESLLIRR